MNLQSGNRGCPGCGTVFECGMGKSEPCWCSTEFPAVMPLPAAARGCYCRACLARLIAAGRQETAATPGVPQPVPGKT